MRRNGHQGGVLQEAARNLFLSHDQIFTILQAQGIQNAIDRERTYETQLFCR